MLKKIKIFLFITITALVLPGLVHAQEASNNIMPGSHVTYGARIADLENQYGKHMARIADLERVERELHAQLAAAPSAAPAMPPTAAPTACTAELTAAKARVASLERELAKAPPAAPTGLGPEASAASAEKDAKIVDYSGIIDDLRRAANLGPKCMGLTPGEWVARRNQMGCPTSTHNRNLIGR